MSQPQTDPSIAHTGLCTACSHPEVRPNARFCAHCGQAFDELPTVKALPIETLLRYYKMGRLGHLITLTGHHYLKEWGSKQEGERIHLQTLVHSIFDFLEQEEHTDAKLLAVIGFGSAFRPARTTPVEKTKGMWWWKETYIVMEHKEVDDVDVIAIFDDNFMYNDPDEAEKFNDFAKLDGSDAKHFHLSTGYGGRWSAKALGKLHLFAASLPEFQRVIPSDHMCQDIIKHGVLLAGSFNGIIGRIQSQWIRDSELDIIVQEEPKDDETNT